MRNLKLLIIVACVFVSNTGRAQETLKVMYYNLLNFPSTSPERVDTLKKIVQHVLPDMFLVNELDNQVGATLILSNALNQNGINYYQQALFVDGPDTDNMLFYNSDKLGLISQNEIETALRDINEYVLYYKAPDLASTLDTAFFYMYSCHLKAGSTAPNLRLAEAQVFKNYLSGKTGLKNVMFGGDFNFYGSSVPEEPAHNWVLNGGTFPLFDPINMTGEWHANSFYANIHTQSTRTTSFDGGATGGLDDRFDFIFVSNDLQTGANKAKYVENSYTAIGNDGAHYNTSLVNPASNGSVPDDVANALHEMSDHLPVYLEIQVGGDVGIADNNFVNSFNFNSVSHELELFLKKNAGKLMLTVYDISGKRILTETYSGSEQIKTSFPYLNSGIYIINLQIEGKSTSLKVVVL
jgi:hypothetical protein